MNSSKERKYLRFILITLAWLVIWEVASLAVSNSILLVGPAKVLFTLVRKWVTAGFWMSIGMSTLRIATGFVIGLVAGVVLAIMAYKIPVVGEFLSPLVAFMKAAPVASFVVLFLIWWHSDVLSTAIAICVVFPQVYVSMLQGLKSTDKGLLEMAQVFKVPWINKVNYIYRPAVKPYMDGAMKIAVSMAWKSGVAAEVIGTPDMTIGESLYMSKIYLDTAGVLAWTLQIILISVVCEKLVLWLYECYCRWEPGCARGGQRGCSDAKASDVTLSRVNFAYGENGRDLVSVLDGYSARYSFGELNVLSSPSGSGKTTILRLIAGLEKPASGIITGNGGQVSMLFQDDRLCEAVSAVKNVEIVCGDEKVAKAILLKLLDEEDIYRPVRELSGGQRRRVAIARACSIDANVLLLDEPYNGLDEDNRLKVSRFVEEYSKDKIVIMASHIAEA